MIPEQILRQDERIFIGIRLEKQEVIRTGPRRNLTEVIRIILQQILVYLHLLRCMFFQKMRSGRVKKHLKRLSRCFQMIRDGKQMLERDTGPVFIPMKNVGTVKQIFCSPVLIDWEAAGHIRPRRELLEVALYWADDGHGGLDAALCEALLTAYAKHMPPRGDWEPVFAAGRANALEWLAYSVRRASGLTSPDEAEVRRGEAEVGKTLESLEGYEAKVDGLKRLLR